MLFYYTAKGTFTKLSKEEALLLEEPKAKQVEINGQTQAQKGSADGNNCNKIIIFSGFLYFDLR